MPTVAISTSKTDDLGVAHVTKNSGMKTAKAAVKVIRAVTIANNRIRCKMI